MLFVHKIFSIINKNTQIKNKIIVKKIIKLQKIKNRSPRQEKKLLKLNTRGIILTLTDISPHTST